MQTDETGARIYRLRQCEKNAGMANVFTEAFLRHGPGRYRLSLDAAAEQKAEGDVETASSPVGAARRAARTAVSAVFISNEKSVKTQFDVPADGAWVHFETEVVLDFDANATDVMALLLRAAAPTDELRFRNISLKRLGD